MNIKKFISSALLVVLLTLLIAPAAGRGRFSAGRSIASPRRFAKTRPRNFHRPPSRRTNPLELTEQERNILPRRAVRQRRNIIRARLRNADTTPSDRIARSGQSHSMTGRVNFPRSKRPRPRLGRNRAFAGLRSYGRRRGYFNKPKPLRRALFKNYPRIRTHLLHRHRRFHRRFDKTRCHFYYYSLPYFVYFYYIPPYYAAPERVTYIYRSDYAPDEKYPQPAEQDKAAKPNQYLAKAAQAFAKADYKIAVRYAAAAVKAGPDNPLALFVHSQSLFANGQYERAADTLLDAIENADIEQQGLFYPLGLYPDENILTSQIEQLEQAVKGQPGNPRLLLLLGYQLLGIGDYDRALQALQTAADDESIAPAASLLIDILEQARQISEQNDRKEQTEQENQQSEY